jgi:hypothetical protein
MLEAPVVKSGTDFWDMGYLLNVRVFSKRRETSITIRQFLTLQLLVVLTMPKFTVLPFTDSNNLKTKYLNLWMRGRRAIDQHQEEEAKRINNEGGDCFNMVDCPALSDVVFKTGTSNLSHPGNSVFHEMIRCQSADASHISPDSVGIILEDVTRRNGRFLEWDSCGYWKVIFDPVAIRQKIYSSLFYAKNSFDASRRHLQSTSSSSIFLFERQDGRKRKRAADGTEVSSRIEISEDSSRFQEGLR